MRWRGLPSKVFAVLLRNLLLANAVPEERQSPQVRFVTIEAAESQGLARIEEIIDGARNGRMFGLSMARIARTRAISLFPLK